MFDNSRRCTLVNVSSCIVLLLEKGPYFLCLIPVLVGESGCQDTTDALVADGNFDLGRLVLQHQ